MKFARTTDPTTAPISTAEAKAHAVVEHSDDDALIDLYVSQAADYAENYTGRQLMAQVWTAYFDAWPACFELPFRPLQSVVIKYTDDAGDEQTLAADQYQVDAQAYPALIRPAPGVSWPDLGDDYNLVRVEVTCGYADAAAVPDGIKAALYLLTGHLYENRESSSPVEIHDVPLGVDSFLTQYRIDF